MGFFDQIVRESQRAVGFSSRTEPVLAQPHVWPDQGFHPGSPDNEGAESGPETREPRPPLGPLANLGATQDTGVFQPISTTGPGVIPVLEEGDRWGRVETFHTAAVEPVVRQKEAEGLLHDDEAPHEVTRPTPENPPPAPDTRGLRSAAGQLGGAEYAGISPGSQQAEFSAGGEEQAESPQESAEITIWEEGSRWGRSEALQTHATKPAARQVVGRLWPLESTGGPGLPEANGNNFFPIPVKQKLKVIGRASMVRESRSFAVESTGLQFLDPEDSCAEMPLAAHVRQSTRGASVETQGSRQAGGETRAAAITPPNLFPPVPPNQEITLGEAQPISKEIPASPLIPLPPFGRPPGTPVRDRPQSQPTPAPEPPGPQVQIGVLEIVVLSPESGQQHTSSSSQRPPANLASRHYLRNL